MKRKCDCCNKEYDADIRNVNRGMGLCCSKSCAAKKRERLKPTYDPKRVAMNNRIRKGKFTNSDWEKLPLTRRVFLNQKKFGVIGEIRKIQGITSDGYLIIDGVVYDENNRPLYDYDENNVDDYSWDAHK